RGREAGARKARGEGQVVSRGKRGPLFVKTKFDDDDEELIKLSEAIYQIILQDAVVMRSQPGEFAWSTRDAAERRLRYVAEAAAEKELRVNTASALSDADIEKAIAKFGNQQDAAASLGISDRQLRTRLKRIRDRK